MTRYEAILFVHVSAAIIWLGAGLTLNLLVYRGERAGDRAAQLGTFAQMEWLANRLFIPASLAVLVFGIILVADGPWTFGQLWIVLGLLGYTASFLVGILYFKPEGERIGAIVEALGPDSPELDRRIAQLAAVGRMELVVLFLVVGAMVAKPVGGDVGTLVVGGILLAAGLALPARAVLRARQSPAVAGGEAAP